MKKTTVESVTILFNLPKKYAGQQAGDAPDVDTWESVLEMEEVLRGVGYEVKVMGVSPADLKKIRTIDSDVVFNRIEWTGHDLKYQVMAFAELRKLGIAYTGSDLRGFMLSADKLRMKKFLTDIGVPTPKYQIFYPGRPIRINRLIKFPRVIKPVYEHCSIGVTQESVVETPAELKERVKKIWSDFFQPVLAEEYIDGRELSVTIIEKQTSARVLPPVEVLFDTDYGKRRIITYDAKWNENSDEFKGWKVKLADLSGSVLGELNRIAKRIYRHMGGGDYPRLDLRLDGKKLSVLEFNANPDVDFTPQGGLGLSARAAGMDMADFLQHVIENCIYRFNADRNVLSLRI